MNSAPYPTNGGGYSIGYSEVTQTVGGRVTLKVRHYMFVFECLWKPQGGTLSEGSFPLQRVDLPTVDQPGTGQTLEVGEKGCGGSHLGQ